VVVDDFATITQKRMTGGLRIDNLEGKNIHIDPGPGALIRSYQFGLNPTRLDAILVSHSHTDHYTDAEVLIEAMTRGMTRNKGTVIGSLSVIKGYKDWGPCISKYHLSKTKNIILKENDTTKLDNIKITATKTIHGDPTCIGFKFQTPRITISYTSDTAYFNELGSYHRGTDILIASVIRPDNEHIRGHMCSDDFKFLIEEVKPKLAIMTHLGMKMIFNDPDGEALRVQEETDTRVIAAKDGMCIDLERLTDHQLTLNDYGYKGPR